MIFWIIATALALLSAGLLTLAVLRGRAGAEPAAVYDLRVYRDQLREVERDLARGVIAEADAERTRVEISRRILAADAQMKAGGDDQGQTLGRPLLIGALAVCLIGGSLWLYSSLGQPGYGDLPRSLRVEAAAEAREKRPSQATAEAEMPPSNQAEAAGADYVDLVERLRETVAARPDDLEGHMLLARNEAVLGNFKAAYEALEGVLRIRGDGATGRDHLNVADMMILAAGGYVSPEAEAHLSDALKLEPQNGGAQYYWGLMHAQTGRPDLSFRIWSRLLASSPPEANWVEPIRAQIEQIAALAGETRFQLPPLAPPPGPSAEDVEAAADLTDEERADMVRNMVDGLVTRLANEGGTADEWARLIRALAVLGDTERAKAIYDEAVSAFAEDPFGLDMLKDTAESAGITQ
ncbi:MAG: c-type cytochrome biogenesis protein CcmI [Paracoccaceae bacterium]